MSGTAQPAPPPASPMPPGAPPALAGATAGMQAPQQSHPIVAQGENAMRTLGAFLQVARSIPTADKTMLEQGAAMLRQGMMMVANSLKGRQQ